MLFPRARAEILRLLFVLPREQRYVRQLMRMSGLALSTVQHELQKLSAIGLVESWSNGYHRFYRPNISHALYSHLLGMVQLSARLPRVKGSTSNRRRSRSRKRRQRKKVRAVMANRAPNWQLFTSRART